MTAWSREIPVARGSEQVPKDTFFNLPDEKRLLICDVALDEFAEYPYDQASINRIVAKSGIAKGSFYQYFEDKKDLFLYLFTLIAEEKINYLSPTLLNPDEHDIYTLIRDLFLSGIQFANEHPRYTTISSRLLADKESLIYRELKTASLPLSIAFFKPLIAKAIDKGEIRADIDIDKINYVITSMNVNIVEYNVNLDSQTTMESMVDSVDTFMEILKNGIGQSNGAVP